MKDEKPCKYCGRAIVWATTDSGKRMPVDVEPVELGNVRLVDGPNGLIAKVTVPAMIPEGERYRSHFATCPKAREARRT